MNQLLSVCLCFALSLTSMFAQTIKASISGIVSDPSGAAISRAKITVMDIDRGITVTTVSNETGFYLVPELTPGNYQITAETPGFRSYVLDSFPLQTQQKATVNILLEVGAISEKVEVAATAQVVEASSATLSAVVENKKIVDLPLNIRNVYSLLRLVPGVIPSIPNSDSDSFTGAHRYSVNGGRESITDVQLDGISALAQSDLPGIYGTSAEPSVESGAQSLLRVGPDWHTGPAHRTTRAVVASVPGVHQRAAEIARMGQLELSFTAGAF